VAVDVVELDAVLPESVVVPLLVLLVSFISEPLRIGGTESVVGNLEDEAPPREEAKTDPRAVRAECADPLPPLEEVRCGRGG